jgi:hypothetical protein
MTRIKMVAEKIMIHITNIANKNTKNRTALILTIMMLITFQDTAYAIPTKWEAVQLSMSELINSGWRISAHGTNRVAANSNAGNGFDESQFSFLLTKNGDYIICIADNPKPPVANNAGCRKLN